ncbi:MAG: MotA/TolQ/ExbB proton channel family protein [Lentimicrobiaceae bacterium]|jgi:biopolymer transport protein ExbB|nr:MotA/TolQ/ExbB proton channel family protein [Lentimicrobiaceae bacterium]
MKKLIALLTIAGFMTFGVGNLFAQTEENVVASSDSNAVVVEEAVVAVEQPVEMIVESEEPATFHEVLKKQFIDGGPEFMGIVLICLIFGLAICIERIIYLTLSTTNTQKLLEKIETAVRNNDIEQAKDICRNTRGPVASIFYQGLLRYDNGLEDVEKSLVSYGSVVTGRLESGVSWIGLFISLAPMLGFMGTAVGMVMAFDDIATAGDMSPTIVASGMKVALLTTIFGLIVAVILQIFYNFIISKIDGLVNDMEDSTITFMDILSKKAKK